MRYLLILLGSLGLAVNPALAQESQVESLPSFKKADQNDDGKLSREEAKAAGVSEESFEKNDFDGDGTISEVTYDYLIRDIGGTG